ncbi:unnamed protein product [Closterium sp. NIES-54]
MASLRVLTFDHEGRPIQFDTWLDDLQLYLLSDSRDSVLLFDHTCGASLAPPATTNSATRSQWLTCDAAAGLAIRNHLPLAECAHFGKHKTAKALYDAVVTRYSSPASAALGFLLLPYLFPELSAFATIADLVRLTVVRGTALMVVRVATVVAAVISGVRAVVRVATVVEVKNSVVLVGAARGTPRTPFFEWCSPSPLAPSYASAAAVDVLGAEDVEAASVSGKRRSSKGKGAMSGGGGSEGGSGGGIGGCGGSGGGGSGGSGGGSGGFSGGGGGSGGSGGSRGRGSGGSRSGAV